MIRYLLIAVLSLTVPSVALAGAPRPQPRPINAQPNDPPTIAERDASWNNYYLPIAEVWNAQKQTSTARLSKEDYVKAYDAQQLLNQAITERNRTFFDQQVQIVRGVYAKVFPK